MIQDIGRKNALPFLVLEIRYLGGVYGGNVKPTPFLCLVLKMLQIQPEKDIIVELIKNENFKYMRALGAFYLRLTGTSLDCYKYLEPLYNDYRKLRYMNRQGKFELLYMDALIDKLLHDDRYCDVILPRIQKRDVLEESENLEPRISALNIDMDENVSTAEEDDTHKRKRSISPQRLKIRKKKHKKSEKNKSRSKSKEGDHHSSHHSKHHKVNGESKSEKSNSKISKEELEVENARRKKLGIQPLRA
ncbi:pre-mRNA-splicing factor 38A-like isoform X2 [Gordionus sp. m RMFG-2023]|uniref:pre-mRNA-splicing factor 38A-like isoform X2 n=1 Tax=Gordionus sp. m RMFG-2023 TaxID=3053472 RepID=UPI0031FC9BA0